MSKEKKVFERNIEPLKVRQARHAAEGPVAAKEYKAKAQAALSRMAQLKAERLARENTS